MFVSQKVILNHSVVAKSLKEELRNKDFGSENTTKTQITMTITEIQYLLSTLGTRSSWNAKSQYSTCSETAYNCFIDLTENNKTKPSGLQNWDGS